MVINDNIKYQKVSDKYYCEICDYMCSHRGNYMKHLNTRKHKEGNKGSYQDNNVSTESNIKSFKCDYCPRSYRFRSGLCRHKKTCSSKQLLEKEDLTKGDLIKLLKLIPAGQTNITNNNQKTYNNNITNQINIQLFLDEKCKDAMTIQNFALQLTLTIEDLIKKRALGLHGGVDNIVIKNLEPIPLLERPIHCTNVKKRQWMVNDAKTGWKEDNGNLLLRQAGFGINKKFNIIWEKAYPGWKENEQLSDKWLQLVKDLNADHSEKEIVKALKKIGPECKLTVQDIKSVL